MIKHEPTIVERADTQPAPATSNALPHRARWVTLAALAMAATYLLVGFALRIPVELNKMPIGGDEHHYITQALSLLDDGDLVVVDDYEQGLYVPYFGRELDPSLWNLMADAGYSGHAPGVGVLITPGIWAGGWAGVVATMAVSMAVAYWLTARAVEELSGQPIRLLGSVVLIGGFLSLPLLSYSHTVYPESFMAPLMAGLILLVIGHARTKKARFKLAFTAMTITGLSLALHPKYSVVHVGVVAYLIVVEAYDGFTQNRRMDLRRASIYAGYGVMWMLLFSWLHEIMWNTFSPTGWFSSAEAGKAIEPSRALVQLIDLFFGSEFGIFVLVPISLLSLAFFSRSLGGRASSTHRRVTLLVLISVLAIAGPSAFSSDWHAGDSPLARYLTPLLPALLVPAAAMAQTAKKRIGPAVLVGALSFVGLFWGLVYLAVPTGFRPMLFGTPGAFGVASETLPVFERIEEALWTASAPTPLPTTIVVFAMLIGLSTWLLASTRRPAKAPQIASPDGS